MKKFTSNKKTFYFGHLLSVSQILKFWGRLNIEMDFTNYNSGRDFITYPKP